MTDSKPSKTALKKQQAELQALGEQLIDLESSELHGMGLDEALLDAVLAAKSIRSRGALRRQKQLIGKLMRQVDAEPIRAALAARDSNGRAAKKSFATAERWRDRVLEEGMPAIEAFGEQTGAATGELEKLYGEARQAFSDRAEKTAKRAVFRYIHDVLTEGSADDN